MGKKTKSSSATTLIARNTRIEGTLEFSGVLEIEGTVAGDVMAPVESKSMVRILQNGRVEGEIRAPQVIINGEVKGDVVAEDQLYLAQKAVIEGNVHYRVIEIEKGARINGSILQLSKDQAPAPAAVEAEASEEEPPSEEDRALANS